MLVLAVRSPHFLESPLDKKIDRREQQSLSQLFHGFGVSYLDFTPLDRPEFAPASLYRDSWHLNEGGAALFTRELADTLRGLQAALGP